MQLPKTLLVPVDFSDTSNLALDYAVDLAKALGGKVVVMHAYELPVYGFPDGALVATVEIATRIMNGAQAGLAALLEKRKDKGVEITSVLRQGVPWDEVHSVAEEVKADMIVIGTHGRGGLARALLGSVAEKIIRTSTRPVLTIRGPHK
ncbi:MAG TPA: universal stress protein [Polyangiaceae bacterium]|nr:universal stress protein [Polyangiaceae bacterium]